MGDGTRGERPRSPFLRWLAAIVVRNPHVRADLDEAFDRDLERGLPPFRAGYRYLANTMGSSWALAVARVRDVPTGTSWLDVRLGIRMLKRQPALTAVAVFALGLGIPVSMIPSHFLGALSADLPFDEGERILGIQNWNVEGFGADPRLIHDFELWREELRSFELMGASRSDRYNVLSEDGRSAPVRGSEVTASTFDLLRVTPLFGRPLVASDEEPGAAEVVVVGYDFWQARLGGDPDVVGRTLRVAGLPHEVVGVMPEGFLFPVNDHLWLPLRSKAAEYERGQGPELRVFGRLADGVTPAQADLEVETVGRRVSAAYPTTHGHLRSEVVPYTRIGQGIGLAGRLEIMFLNFVALMLLALACGNVGVLVLAKTAMRRSEIVVRTALGAGRRRIVSQIFVETLVMAVLAAGLGLVVGDITAGVLERSLTQQGGDALLELGFPFWLDFGVRAETVLWALTLAVGSAVIAGVVPALKATGQGIQRNLQRAAAGTSGVRFGGLSSALIVAEVGISVWLLTMGGTLAPGALGTPSSGMGIDPQHYLTASVSIPWTEPPAEGADTHAEEFRSSVAETQAELARLLRSEAGVDGAVFANALPGDRTPGARVEVEGEAWPDGDPGHRVRAARVDVDFFRALGQPIRSGRNFSPEDVAEENADVGTAVIVNTTFVDQVLGGRSPLGKRIRTIDRTGSTPGPWHEIVGVVGRLGMNEANPRRDAGFYQPVSPGDVHPIRVAIRAPGEPTAFTPRLREIAAGVNPAAMIGNPRPMTEVVEQSRWDNRWGTLAFGAMAAVAIVLSTAGLYALISFTVSERTREIGIRTALGAPRGKIVLAVGRRAAFQLLGGIAIGAALSMLIAPRVFDGPSIGHGSWPVLVGIVSALTFATGLFSCVPPTLRGLRIRAADALKLD